jgi:hypothetical protein
VSNDEHDVPTTVPKKALDPDNGGNTVTTVRNLCRHVGRGGLSYLYLLDTLNAGQRSLVSLGIPLVYGNNTFQPNKTSHTGPVTSLIRLVVWERQVS